MIGFEDVDIRFFLRLVQAEGVDVAICTYGDTVAEGASVFEAGERAGYLNSDGLTREGRKLLATLQ